MMNDPDGPRDNSREESIGEASTAARVEDWLRGLRAQRAVGNESGVRGARPQGGGGDDPADAFLRAARRLASSPRAQEALARRLAEAGTSDDPALRALASVLESLGRQIVDAMGSAGGSGGAAGVLDRPEVVEDLRLSDGNGGGDDDIFDDDDDGGGGDDDEEPWPSAFVGYRVGVVDSVDVGNCREGCCTAVFVDHPGLRAAVWFPTETAATLAGSLAEWLQQHKGEAADLGVPPFGAGDPPARGQVQAAIQFFTDDVHLDLVEEGGDKRQGGFARFVAYDAGLGHGGPPLVDVLIDVAQARALRRGLRRAARGAAKDRE